MRRAAVAVLALALFVGAVSVWGGAGERVEPEPVALTVDAGAARAVLGDFVAVLNSGDADTAFALMANGVRARPEAIDGPDLIPFLDFDQELEYARSTAILGGERTVEACSVKRWVHLVDGTRQPEDAQVLACRGTFTSEFIAAVGLDPMPIEVTVAVDRDLEIALYQEWVVDEAATALSLDFRRWLRAHHPDDELRVFTPGGTPRATVESAAPMMQHAPAFAANLQERAGSM